MPKRKTAITVDPVKADRASALLGTTNFSETVDRALDVLIRQEQGRRDVEAYARIPEEPGLAAAGARPVLDDTDWEEIYKDVL